MIQSVNAIKDILSVLYVNDNGNVSEDKEVSESDIKRIKRTLLENGFIPAHANRLKPENAIALVWTTIDVMGRARETGNEITEDEARTILEQIERRHDTNMGVTWHTVDYYISTLKKSKE